MSIMTVVVNGKEHPLATETSLEGIVAEFAPGTPLVGGGGSVSGSVRGVAVAVNQSVVPRGSWASTAIHSGDHIEILQAVQGG